MANKRSKPTTLPLVPLRGAILFPNALMSLEIGRPQSVEGLEAALDKDSIVFLTSQRNITTEEPLAEELYEVGTVAKVRQAMRMPDGMVRIVVEGLRRGRIKTVVQQHPFFLVRFVNVLNKPNTDAKTDDVQALLRSAWEAFEMYADLQQRFSHETLLNIKQCDDPGILSDILASHANFKTENNQLLLEETDTLLRLEKTVALLDEENAMIKLQRKIIDRVRLGMDKNQREYFLREQIKAINTELNESDENDVSSYREQIVKANLPAEAAEKLARELKRLERMSSSSPETALAKDYIECVLQLPWNEKTEDNNDLINAEKILNEDHYGLEKVKERIIEFLAVRQTAKRKDAPVLCLLGPPGVGKTSVAKSVARALGRKYVRISLGGVRDEADIRGHRKTYIGSMPGRIIAGMRQAGTANPLILLDEADKMGHDHRGNPAAALLEVLDGEQNHAFRDHYVELYFDLSDVMFVCTANTLDNMPPALIDRLEIIELGTYTAVEKYEIAVNHLIPKQLDKHGVKKTQLKFTGGAIDAAARFYTREAGVRQLERQIAKICRKFVTMRAKGICKTYTVTEYNLAKFLGVKKYKPNDKPGEPQVGICRGLAWTAAGGDTLSIEVNTMPGTGKFELTGSLGSVMKESAHAAVSYIRSRYETFKIHKNFYKDTDIHIHIPDGAVPKDGPSAGITMATAMISALTGRAVDASVAMTGEITIRGKVLPVGGLKEKILAAKQAGIQKVLVPFENEGEIGEIPAVIKDGLKLVPVRHMDDVLPEALWK
ncbi:MAG: endopeptidase La [Defluviitaleaceae bacterium]|nr:endopeptidase La [Defluviitaleaceae bacterium]